MWFLFQTRQPTFVQLLQGAFRVSHCEWLSGQQKFHVENCIKTLSDIGKSVLLDINSFHGIRHFSSPTLRAIRRLAILMFHHFEKFYK